MKIKEIIYAWYRRFFGTLFIKNIAAERKLVCDGCEKKAILMKVEICSICHCPLAGKTFTVANTCPMNKWVR